MNTTMECPRTRTFHDVEKMIYSTCHSFKRKFGGQLDSLIDEAHLQYCSAYQTFDPHKAQFTTWVYRSVWHGLLEKKRQDTQRAARYPRQEYDLGRVADRIKCRFLDMSQDANTVIRIALSRKEIGADKKRRAIIEVLGDLGWSESRITGAFEEVQGALS